MVFSFKAAFFYKDIISSNQIMNALEAAGLYNESRHSVRVGDGSELEVEVDRVIITLPYALQPCPENSVGEGEGRHQISFCSVFSRVKCAIEGDSLTRRLFRCFLLFLSHLIVDQGLSVHVRRVLKAQFHGLHWAALASIVALVSRPTGVLSLLVPPLGQQLSLLFRRQSQYRPYPE